MSPHTHQLVGCRGQQIWAKRRECWWLLPRKTSPTCEFCRHKERKWRRHYEHSRCWFSYINFYLIRFTSMYSCAHSRHGSRHEADMTSIGCVPADHYLSSIPPPSPPPPPPHTHTHTHTHPPSLRASSCWQGQKRGEGRSLFASPPSRKTARKQHFVQLFKLQSELFGRESVWVPDLNRHGSFDPIGDKANRAWNNWTLDGQTSVFRAVEILTVTPAATECIPGAKKKREERGVEYSHLGSGHFPLSRSSSTYFCKTSLQRRKRASNANSDTLPSNI